MAKKIKPWSSWILPTVIMSVAEMEREAEIWGPGLVVGDSSVSNFLGALCALARNLDMANFFF